MYGIERRRHRQRGLAVALADLAVGLDPVDALLREQPARRAEQRHRLQQVARHQRDLHVQLEAALQAADRDRRVVADHLRRHLAHHLGDHRVDLAGHDRAALLQLRDEDLGQPRPRSRAHPAQVVRDLRQRHGDDPSARADASTSPSRLACASNGSAGGRISRPVSADSRSRTCAANSGMRVQPGADRGAAQRDLAQPLERRLDPRMALAHLGRVAAELLAERDRHGVHQVRAPGLDHVGELLGLARERVAQPRRGRQQLVDRCGRAPPGARPTGTRRSRTGPC